MRLMLLDIERALKKIRSYAREEKAITYITGMNEFSIFFNLKMRNSEHDYCIYFQDFKIRNAGE